MSTIHPIDQLTVEMNHLLEIYPKVKEQLEKELKESEDDKCSFREINGIEVFEQTVDKINELGRTNAYEMGQKKSCDKPYIRLDRLDFFLRGNRTRLIELAQTVFEWNISQVRKRIRVENPEEEMESQDPLTFEMNHLVEIYPKIKQKFEEELKRSENEYCGLSGFLWVNEFKKTVDQINELGKCNNESYIRLDELDVYSCGYKTRLIKKVQTVFELNISQVRKKLGLQQVEEVSKVHECSSQEPENQIIEALGPQLTNSNPSADQEGQSQNLQIASTVKTERSWSLLKTALEIIMFALFCSCVLIFGQQLGKLNTRVVV